MRTLSSGGGGGGVVVGLLWGCRAVGLRTSFSQLQLTSGEGRHPLEATPMPLKPPLPAAPPSCDQAGLGDVLVRAGRGCSNPIH